MDLDHFVAKIVKLSTQHRWFYHFTDKANLPLIRKHGLWSNSELRSHGFHEDVVMGGDANSQESDRLKGTDRFVCLCFTDSHPMEYVARIGDRKLNATYLGIDPDVIKLPGVMITSAPSNQSGVERMEAATGLDKLDLPVIYTWMNWKDAKVMDRLKVARKYELLVPTRLASKYIIRGL